MNRIIIALLFITAALKVGAQDTNSPSRAENIAVVEKTYRENLARYDNKDRYLVKRALLADKKKQTITILGEATGIEGKSIVEFFVIYEKSGHDYEALAISFAKPYDVHEALEFIGLKPGRSVSIRDNAFWPKGERVTMCLNGKRIEDFTYDGETGQATPRNGLVFTGGIMIPSREVLAKKVYAANEREPNSIASNYNEPESVLDVPRYAPQKTVYGNNIMSAEAFIPKGRFVEITIEPEYRNGQKRVVDLDLKICLRPDASPVTGTNSPLSSLNFFTPEPISDMESLVRFFQKMIENGQDPFVTLKFDDNLPLSAVRDFCKTITLIDKADGIRIEPPAAGHLYYKAYFPPEHFLDREKRMAQPFELVLERKQGRITGILKQIKQVWKDNSVYPDLVVTDHPVGSPAELRTALDNIPSDLPAILIMAAGDMTYGEVMAYVKPALTTHPLVHIFTDVDPGKMSNKDTEKK